jgi:hypothetical protein
LQYKFYWKRLKLQQEILTQFHQRDTLTNEVNEELNKLGKGWRISQVTTTILDGDPQQFFTVIDLIVFEKPDES